MKKTVVNHLEGEVWICGFERIKEVMAGALFHVPHVQRLLPPHIPLVVKYVHVHPTKCRLPTTLQMVDTQAKARHPWKLAHLQRI